MGGDENIVSGSSEQPQDVHRGHLFLFLAWTAIYSTLCRLFVVEYSGVRLERELRRNYEKSTTSRLYAGNVSS